MTKTRMVMYAGTRRLGIMAEVYYGTGGFGVVEVDADTTPGNGPAGK